MAKRSKTNITGNYSTYKKERYEKLKERKLCVICRKPIDNGKVVCKECAMYTSKKLRTKRQELYEKDICIRCGKPNHSQYFNCESCRIELREYQKKIRNSRKNA